MKKISITLVAVVAALAMASCTKEQFNEPEQSVQNDSVTESGFIVTASTEDNLTKTSLYGNDTDGYDILWSENDIFTLLYWTESNDLDSKNFSLTNGEGGTTAEFVAAGYFADGDSPYLAVYPSSIVKAESSAQKGYVDIEWPSRQTYEPGNIKDCPMYAAPANFKGPYQFKNLGGILRVRVKGTGTLSSVSISSDNVMAGDAVIQPLVADGGKTYSLLIQKETEKKEITLTCGQDGVKLKDTYTDFNFSVPAGTYKNLKVTCCFNEGGIVCESTRRCTKDVVVERSMITDASFPTITPAGAFVGITADNVISGEDVLASLMDRIHEIPIEGIGTFDWLIKSILQKAVPEGKEYHIKKINYLTPSPEGGYALASGVFAFSNDVWSSKTFDRIVSVQHGTCDISKAPSLQDFCVELCPVLATSGVGKKGRDLVVLADYIGYGSSRAADLQQTYMHMGYTGSASADMLRAVENYLAKSEELSYAQPETGGVKKPISLIGYSQGGEASIATLYALEDIGYESRVTEVLAGAGPHDLVEMLNFFRSRKKSDTETIPYAQAGYIPYMIRGILYGDQALEQVRNIDLSGIYAPETFEKKDMFDKTMLSTWHTELGTDITKVLHEDFFKDKSLMNESAKTLYDRAVENSNIKLCPLHPEKVKLYHNRYDDQVPYACSVNAQAKWGCGKIVELTGITTTSSSIKTIKNAHALSAVEFYLRYLGAWDSTVQFLFYMLAQQFD